MNILSPKLTAKDVSAATERNFTSAPVEAGEYDMVINPKGHPLVLTSKAGNKYLQLMLIHASDENRGATAVYPNFNLNEVGTSQFTQLLLALGFTPEAVVGSDSALTGWGDTESVDEKGRAIAEIQVSGEIIDLAGRAVRVYLKKTESEFNSKTTVRNEVGRFIIG